MDEEPISQTEDTATAFAVFVVGSAWLAVPAERTVRILALPAVTGVPLAPPSVLGVAIAGGRPLAVLDLALVLGLQRGEAAAPRCLVVDTRAGAVGLAVEAVAGLELVAAAGVRASGEDGRGFAAGTFTSGDHHVTVLDVERLVESIEASGSGH